MFNRTQMAGVAVGLGIVLAACDQTSTPSAPDVSANAAALSSTNAVGPAQAAPVAVNKSNLGQPVPSSVIVAANGLEWVWASPCTPPPDGCTSGIDEGHDGFLFATNAQWSLRPPVSAFSIPAQCASPWFDHNHNHCDLGDALNGFYGSSPNWQSGPNGGQRHPNAETWLVRAAGQACETGFWRNNGQQQGWAAWFDAGFSPWGSKFDPTFGTDFFDLETSLVDAIRGRVMPSSRRAVARVGTAALLNASHPGISYPFSVADVIAAVQNVDVPALRAMAKASDDLSCPL